MRTAKSEGLTKCNQETKHALITGCHENYDLRPRECDYEKNQH